ncbi:hypothetical protein [Actinophytocola oryzae]|uniref:Uncharacterized protein n=1 Tax=Actinophytocola oryzae TaxID=502181 RepID=A0A4V3FUE6_9PSEU|nr:hypothetical protein [Actinophytocola oryzae]TDV54861.1 hypothetical protein CLV71_103102 [Actinophytocola oryzae]
MRRLRLRCEDCGEVTLPASDVIVSGAAEPGRVNCSFRCPVCGGASEQGCDVAAGRLLLMGGARTRPAAEPVAPPIGLADLVLLRELLNRPDFVDIMAKKG